MSGKGRCSLAHSDTAASAFLTLRLWGAHPMSLQRVHLDIQVGEHANNYPEIAAKDKLTELQLRARQLLDQVEQIQKEQDYQRVRACRCPGTRQLTLTPTTPTGVSA